VSRNPTTSTMAETRNTIDPSVQFLDRPIDAKYQFSQPVIPLAMLVITRSLVAPGEAGPRPYAPRDDAITASALMIETRAPSLMVLAFLFNQTVRVASSRGAERRGTSGRNDK